MTSPSDHDPVNRPAHYTFGRFEVIDVLEEWFPNEPLLWQVGKYVARWNRKGNALENLKKAAYYLNRKIERLESQQRANELALAVSEAAAKAREAELRELRDANLIARGEEGE